MTIRTYGVGDIIVDENGNHSLCVTLDTQQTLAKIESAEDYKIEVISKNTDGNPLIINYSSVLLDLLVVQTLTYDVDGDFESSTLSVGS